MLVLPYLSAISITLILLGMIALDQKVFSEVDTPGNGETDKHMDGAFMFPILDQCMRACLKVSKCEIVKI